MAFGTPSPPLPLVPKQHQGLTTANTVPTPLFLSVETTNNQTTSIDGQNSTISPEIDFGKEDSAQPSGESGSRRRNINSSKRAAQNRAAQRAFRLRRERYVASLEEKARSYDRLEAAYLDIQRENYQLRSRLNKIQSENAILRTHLAAGAHVSSQSPPSAVTPSFLQTSTPVTDSSRMPRHHNAGLRPPPQEPNYQYHHHTHNSHQLPQHHSHYPASYHQRRCDYQSTVTVRQDDNPQCLQGYSHSQPTVHSTASHTPSGPSLPPSSSMQYRRHQPPVQQRSMLQREHSLPHTLNPHSPTPASTPAEGLAMRFEPETAPVHSASSVASFASPVERMPSPGGMWDNAAAAAAAAAVGNASSPAMGMPPHKPLTSSETTSSSSSATAAQMLPSVREITMSIGALLPTSPHSDRSLPPPSQFSSESADNRKTSGCTTDAVRRPW
ncbi:hypothetical protein BX070DRAFT_235024 [Coemansia spiralis]|nr:hypothetical protein BX070DRAFT_235024 [Coemansia spiralis]